MKIKSGSTLKMSLIEVASNFDNANYQSHLDMGLREALESQLAGRSDCSTLNTLGVHFALKDMTHHMGQQCLSGIIDSDIKGTMLAHRQAEFNFSFLPATDDFILSSKWGSPLQLLKRAEKGMRRMQNGGIISQRYNMKHVKRGACIQLVFALAKLYSETQSEGITVQ